LIFLQSWDEKLPAWLGIELTTLDLSSLLATVIQIKYQA